MSFGEWLRSKRKASGLTQAQLAAAVGLSKAYIGHLENARPHGTTGAPPQPKPRWVQRLAEAMSADADEALRLAGYAAEGAGEAHRFNGVSIVFHEDCGLNSADKQNILSTIALMVEGLKATSARRRDPGMSDIIPTDLTVIRVPHGGVVDLTDEPLGGKKDTQQSDDSQEGGRKAS